MVESPASAMRVVRASVVNDHSGPSSTCQKYIFPASNVGRVLNPSAAATAAALRAPDGLRTRPTFGRALRDGVHRSVTPAGSTFCAPFSGYGVDANGSTGEIVAGSHFPSNVHKIGRASCRERV